MIAHYLFTLMDGAAAEVGAALPPFPDKPPATSALPATRNRRQFTLPDVGTLRLRTDRLTGSAMAHLRAPAGLQSDYTMIMPASLPGAEKSVAIDSNNVLNFQGWRETISDFVDDNLTTNRTNAAMDRFSDGSGKTLFVPPRSGSVTGISIRSNEARTAGTATAEIYVNGTSTGLAVTLNSTDTTFKAATQAAGTDTFSAGDTVEVYLQSASWTPTTADIQCSLEIET